MMDVKCLFVKTALFLSLTGLGATTVFSGELILDAGVDAELIEQSVKVKTDNTDIDSTNQIFSPFIATNYIARDLNVFFRGKHNWVRRELADEVVTNNYTDFQYNAIYQAIPNLISINLAGTQGFRSQGINSFLVDDFLFNADNLNKVSSDTATLNLTLPTGDYFGLNSSIRYSNSQSEFNSNADDTTAGVFENENYNATLGVESGSDIKALKVNLDTSVSYSKRDNNQDFINQFAQLSLDFKLYSSIGLALNAAYENNDIRNEDDSFDGAREFSSLGIGLIWQPSQDRSIEVTWNTSVSDSAQGLFEGNDTEDETDNFVGLDVDWAFSPRTSVSASFSRRFFGDSGNVNITHQLRNWRSRLTYNETINTNSQLASTIEPGLLICENGSTDIADCQLSDNLEPVLDPGQILLPISSVGFELNDRVILRKQLQLYSAITRRRTTVALTATKATSDELEIDSEIESNILLLDLIFNISARTNIRLGHTYTDAERLFNAELTKSKVNQTTLQLEHKFFRRLSATLGYRYVDKDGDLAEGGANLAGINGPFSENRITLKLSYNYGNRR